MADVWTNSMACHPRATCYIAGCCHLANSMSWSGRAMCHITGCCNQANSTACHPRATYHIAGCCHLMNSLSWFQCHMPHCRVQSPGEINVMIVPHCRVWLIIATTFTIDWQWSWEWDNTILDQTEPKLRFANDKKTKHESRKQSTNRVLTILQRYQVSQCIRRNSSVDRRTLPHESCHRCKTFSPL